MDLEVLARSLQELPLHHKLDLEPSLVQVAFLTVSLLVE